MIERIHWLGHASFRINGPPHADGAVIYIDPWCIPPDSPPADLILISHDHYDHCSPQDVARIRRQGTVILASERAASLIGKGAQVLRPWQAAVNVYGVSVRAVPAYTISHAYHNKAFGGVGFIISLMDHDIYFAGDTDLIPEMDKIGCDIALLPVGGAFTMSYEEAAEAAQRLRPKYAIPMHYGREIPGSKGHGRSFVRLVNGGVQAVELTPENERMRI